MKVVCRHGDLITQGIESSVTRYWGYGVPTCVIPVTLGMLYCSLLLMDILIRMAWPGVYAPINVSPDYPPHGEEWNLEGISISFSPMPLHWGTSESLLLVY